MPACSTCNAEVPPSAVYLTSSGPVCDKCHLAEEAKGANAIYIARPGFDSDSPEKRMLTGGAVFGAGVVWLVVGLVFLDTLYFYPLFLILPGFAMFARGLHLYRGRRR
jgi:hypothetical protein